MHSNATSLQDVSETHPIEVHDLLKIVGHKNKFQYKILVTICLVLFSMAFVLPFVSYAFLTPKFKCPSSTSNR